MSDATSAAWVEVRSNPIGTAKGNEYYLAQVKDVNQRDSTFLVEYENKQRSNVDSNRVRQRPKPTAVGWLPSENDHVEVCQFGERESDPTSWREAIVASFRKQGTATYYMCKGMKSGDQTEAVTLDRLRPAFSHTKDAGAKALQFHRFVIKLPPTLRKAVELDPLMKKSGASSLYYDKGNHSVVVLGDERSIEKATILLDQSVRHNLDLQYLEEQHQQLSALSQKTKAEFTIDQKLIGNAFGKGGEYINKVPRPPRCPARTRTHTHKKARSHSRTRASIYVTCLSLLSPCGVRE